MVTAERVRALAAAGRGDTGPAPDGPPESGSHFAVLVKPEVMVAPHAAEALATAVGVLDADGTAVLRAAVLPATEFVQRGYLLLHYPRLHRVAADGVAALTTTAREALRALPAGAGGDALGAYEAMTREAGLTPRSLEERCRAAGVHKLGSGSYASPTEVNGSPAVVLNGFLPALTAGYAAPGARVGMLECHSPREIAVLRRDLLGALHPGTAAPASLRGALGELGRRHGIELSEGRNAVHLSAGHLEAMFQVWRYFAAPDKQGPTVTAFGRSLAAAGVPEAALAALASDPDLPAGAGGTLAPHGATEDLDRDAALRTVRGWTTHLAGSGRKETS